MLRLPEVVDIIKTRIHSREYEPGSQLPPERVLSEQLGVSRRTLRKALQSLEEEQYLWARSHEGRGWYVSDLSLAAERWRAGIAQNPRPFDQQLDFRMAIETASATLAALRRTDRDLIDLEDSLLQQEDLGKTLLERREINGGSETSVSGSQGGFHQAIARATHNASVVQVLHRARADLFLAVHDLVHYDALLTSVPEHRRIFEAIKAQDPGEAVSAMVAHVENQNALIRELLDKDHSERILADRAGHARENPVV